VRLITWNVARRVEALVAQATALATRKPDVVALQEVTERTWPEWRRVLEAVGLVAAACSLETAVRGREPASRRRAGVVLAARTPLGPAEPLPVPWPETTLAALVDGVVVHNAHVPNAANGWVKIDTLRALRAGLAAGDGPRILCGDLNTPRREQPDGTVVSFARDSRGRLREERGTAWDEGETGVVPGLRDVGFADAFRVLHGYERREPSWTWRRIAGHDGGYRLDHVFASRELRPLAARYHHDWRDAGWSDHSALEVDLA
jgi:exodeoxyribonuclease-3